MPASERESPSQSLLREPPQPGRLTPSMPSTLSMSALLASCAAASAVSTPPSYAAAAAARPKAAELPDGTRERDAA